MEEHAIKSGVNGRLFLRTCSCGWRASAQTDAAAIAAAQDHMTHVLLGAAFSVTLAEAARVRA